jgi:hypothetical protein
VTSFVDCMGDLLLAIKKIDRQTGPLSGSAA